MNARVNTPRLVPFAWLDMTLFVLSAGVWFGCVSYGDALSLGSKNPSMDAFMGGAIMMVPFALAALFYGQFYLTRQLTDPACARIFRLLKLVFAVVMFAGVGAYSYQLAVHSANGLYLVIMEACSAAAMLTYAVLAWMRAVLLWAQRRTAHLPNA